MEKLKTYSEASGKEYFDWNKALDELENIGLRFFMERPLHKEKYRELEKLISLARGWVTCACGNQCVAIPRNLQGNPIDGRLSSLGVEFYDDIQNAVEYFVRSRTEDEEKALRVLENFRHLVRVAKNTLMHIENRSAYILRSL